MEADPFKNPELDPNDPLVDEKLWVEIPNSPSRDFFGESAAEQELMLYELFGEDIDEEY